METAKPLDAAAALSLGMLKQKLPYGDPRIATGVHIPPKREPQTKRRLAYSEMSRICGVNETVRMNFVPQMLTGIIHAQALIVVDYCRDHRLSEFKKLTRTIKMSVEEYTRRLAEAYGPNGFKAYCGYFDRYQQRVYADLVKMQWHAETLCKSQHSGHPHPELAATITIVRMLIESQESIDKYNDQRIAEKTGVPVHTPKDAYTEIIRAMLIEFEETYGMRIEADQHLRLWVDILANRATLLADALIEEEREDGRLYEPF